MPLILAEPDVRAVLAMPDLIDEMRSALIAYSSGAAQQPLRTVLEADAGSAFIAVMPASLARPAALGTKLVTVFPANHHKGLPSHLATILLLDPDTGMLLALIDGRYITEARTAAVSALSVDLLARRDAGVLAVLGSGVQARSHVDAIACVRTLREVRVWSPNTDHREAFARVMAPRVAAPVTTAASARDAVRDADLIVTATAAPAPVLDSDWVRDGAHICAVGACRPSQRELEGALVARARTFVDSRVGAFAEAGDILLAIADGVITRDHVVAELGEVAAGVVDGRQGEQQVTLFKSLGMAVEDVAAARFTLERAKARGLGNDVVL